MNDLTYDQKLRVEALRAASLVTSSTYSALIAKSDGSMSITGEMASEDTIHIAEIFTTYLEGEKE